MGLTNAIPNRTKSDNERTRLKLPLADAWVSEDCTELVDIEFSIACEVTNWPTESPTRSVRRFLTVAVFSGCSPDRSGTLFKPPTRAWGQRKRLRPLFRTNVTPADCQPGTTTSGRHSGGSRNPVCARSWTPASAGATFFQVQSVPAVSRKGTIHRS